MTTGTGTGQTAAHFVISGTYAGGAFTVTGETYSETGSYSATQSTLTTYPNDGDSQITRVDATRTGNRALKSVGGRRDRWPTRPAKPGLSLPRFPGGDRPTNRTGTASDRRNRERFAPRLQGDTAEFHFSTGLKSEMGTQFM